MDRTKNQIEIKFRIYIHIHIYYIYLRINIFKKKYQPHHREPSVKKTSLHNIALGTWKVPF